MAWKKASEELTHLLEEYMPGFDVEFRKMFGSPVYFVRGNMFAGVHQDNIMLRLKPDDQEILFAEHDEAAPFEPMGRRMKEYVLLPPSVSDNDEQMRKWLDISYDYVSSLPLKEKKEKKEKKKP
ncbi:TfoX/Sxy family protein [Methanolobus sp. WCC4]|uniref:TfoX/Sxy family protein n=1 Tax=Methanolobus sp. WCC4 TaxID=3125784 RepID=UPI0030FC2B3A